jgi:hypothetical protein
MSEAGAAFIPGALAEPFRVRLREQADLDGFEALSELEGQVRQQGELFVIAGDMSGHPAIKQLRDELTDAVHECSADIAMLDQWDPNEAALQRYRAGAVGITPHRDMKRYRYLVAVFTVEGTARFTHCRDRAGDSLATWSAAPGSLVLLRGPGLGGIDDGRPMHAVSGPPTGTRVSLGIRMNTRPDA